MNDEWWLVVLVTVTVMHVLSRRIGELNSSATWFC